MRKGSEIDVADWRLANKLFLAQSPAQNRAHADLTAPGASRTTNKDGNGTNLENPAHEELRGEAEAAPETPNPMEQVAGEIRSSITKIMLRNRVNVYQAVQMLVVGMIKSVFKKNVLPPNQVNVDLVLMKLCEDPQLALLKEELSAFMQKIVEEK